MDPQPRLHPTSPGRAAARPDIPVPSFAHASEAEFARILDFYGVAWEYEPHTFPLLWNLRGEVVESFTPDFFLAEIDLHVELTTLRQKLVRKKNRKLRRMHDLYPDVRVKLLYGKDFRALLLKFGRIGLADALSGAVGQTTPPRDPGGRRDRTADGRPHQAAADGGAGDVPRTGVTERTGAVPQARASTARTGTGRAEARRGVGQGDRPTRARPRRSAG